MKTLNDFEIGDEVILWCIGPRVWDNLTVKIIDKGILITVEYLSGRSAKFSQETNCKKS